MIWQLLNLEFKRTFNHQIGKSPNYQINCGQSRVRTYVHLREQIYSLSPLTTRPSAQLEIKTRAENWSRTSDLLITNQLLYQLSYFGIFLRTYLQKILAIQKHPYFLGRQR